jgi:hypothetical protein
MQTWAVATFVMILFLTMCRALLIGISGVDYYPRKVSRLSDTLDMMFNLVWLAWGLLAIW